MKLRDYQRAASDAVLTEWQSNRSTLVSMATGLGKTVLAADIIRRIHPRKTLFLAHRQELIFQARERIEEYAGLKCEIEMGDSRAAIHGLFGTSLVVVSSIQTQTAGGDGGGRMTRFNPLDFGAVIVDEAHHACAGSYRRVLDYYGTNPETKILGITATPDRADEEALGQVFESVAFEFEILDGIAAGWLVPVDQQMVTVAGLDFSAVRTTAGDLNGAELAAIMEMERNLHELAGPSIEIIGDRRTLAFTSSVAHAEKLCEIFNRHRSGMAAWVCGATPPDDRKKILDDFKRGEVQVVCNCAVLTEGFDNPAVEVILMGKPTKSRALYAQMCGRATRPLPGIVDNLDTPDERKTAIAMCPKPSCLIVDFVGNAGKHKLISSADILGGNISDAALERTLIKARKDGQRVRMSDALAEAEEELRIEAEQRKLEEQSRQAHLVARAKYSTQSVSPFDIFHLTPTRQRGWDQGKQLTEKQRNLLSKQGINPDSLPYHAAKQLIGEIFKRWDANLCSFKQAKLLSRHGYPTDVTRDEAKKIIDGLAANGWRRV